MNRAEKMRMVAVKEVGCIVALERGLGFVPCEIHHLTLGGRHGQKRRGHECTVGLNPWSHRGVPFGGMAAERCRELFGPSYAREPRAFRELYPDDWLLEIQDQAIAAWSDSTIGGGL